MAKKKKAEAEQPVEPEVKHFEYGDLSVICKCGRIQTIAKGIEKGLQLVLTTREDSYIQLTCDECDAEIKLCLLEGSKPEPEVNAEPEEEKPNERIQEESKQE